MVTTILTATAGRSGTMTTQAYINIYDNGRAVIRYADLGKREDYIEYDGSMPAWRNQIIAAAKAATESK